MNYLAKLESITPDEIIVDRIERFRVPIMIGAKIVLEDEFVFDVIGMMVEPNSDQISVAVVFDTDHHQDTLYPHWDKWTVRTDANISGSNEPEPGFRSSVAPAYCVVCGAASAVFGQKAPWTCGSCQ
jgi:hypothetical protein